MPDAAIRIMCPNLRCRAVLAVPPEARGRLVRCRNCGMNIKIPPKKLEPAAAAPAPGAAEDAAPAKGAEAKPKGDQKAA